VSDERPLRDPPRLEVLFPLESEPQVRFVAETAEDEQRLCSWLVRSGTWGLICGLRDEFRERRAA